MSSIAATAAPVLTPPSRAPASLAGTRHAAEDFTATFFTESLESVYAGMAPDPVFGGGSSETIYRSMLLQQFGKIIAGSGTGRGIADAVQREIIHLQETA